MMLPLAPPPQFFAVCTTILFYTFVTFRATLKSGGMTFCIVFPHHKGFHRLSHPFSFSHFHPLFFQIHLHAQRFASHSDFNAHAHARLFWFFPHLILNALAVKADSMQAWFCGRKMAFQSIRAVKTDSFTTPLVFA